MKTRISLFALLCSVGLSAQPARISIVRESGERGALSSSVPSWRYRVELAIPPVRVTDDELSLSELSVEGLLPTQQAGRPELPATGTLFAVPEGFEIAVEGIAVKQERLEHVVVKPAQKKTRCGEVREFSFDRTVYDADEFYPANWVRLEKVGVLATLPLYRLALHPVRFHPRLEQAMVARELSFTVQIVNRSARKPLVMSATMLSVANSMAANVADLPIVLRDQPESYLVASADNLVASLGPFLEWKKRKGFQVRLATFSEMGGDEREG